MNPLVYLALSMAFVGVVVLVVTITYWLTTRSREVMADSDSRD
ncbi:MAG: hypothetical protein ABSC31_13685 [Acidimicrobiales bacterium]|jgi:hypothetical protein